MSSSLLGDYLQFLRSPDLTPPPRPYSLKQVIIQSLRLYSLHLLVLLVVGVLIGQIIDEGDSLLPDLFNEIPAEILFLFAVVAAPIVEELLFRLPLRGSLFNLGFSSSLFLGLGLVGFTPLRGAVLMLIVVVLTSLNLQLWRLRPPSRAIAQFYQRFPRLIFYTLTVLFGAVHITNYGTQVWLFLPLLVLPQVIIGLLFGFVRVRYGFAWAIGLHAFHNGCLLLPVFCLQLWGSAQLQQQGLENLDLNTLAWGDQLLMAGVGLYFMGGLILCIVTAWGLVREGRKKTTH
ncbi:MAG: CPBP family glutamic-type intramembrane protease [Cyanobacteria bacterium P01_G01_bin.54]